MVFDTNIYVAALREGLGGPSFDRLEEAAPRTFLASVVSAALRAGAVDDVGRRTIIELVKRFERLGRVVVPTAGSWNDAGDVLAKIARRQPGFRTKDALIGPPDRRHDRDRESSRLRATAAVHPLRIGNRAGRSRMNQQIPETDRDC